MEEDCLICDGVVLTCTLLSWDVEEDMLLGVAHQMYKGGNYKQALEHSNVVYERNPLRTDNLLLLGAIHYQVVALELFCFLIGLALLFANLMFIPTPDSYLWYTTLQLHDFDMCIARNEEAIQIEPHFAECFGNMANAWKVIVKCWLEMYQCFSFFNGWNHSLWINSIASYRKKEMLIWQSATT